MEVEFAENPIEPCLRALGCAFLSGATIYFPNLFEKRGEPNSKPTTIDIFEENGDFGDGLVLSLPSLVRHASILVPSLESFYLTIDLASG